MAGVGERQTVLEGALRYTKAASVLATVTAILHEKMDMCEKALLTYDLISVLYCLGPFRALISTAVCARKKLAICSCSAATGQRPRVYFILRRHVHFKIWQCAMHSSPVKPDRD